MYPVVDPSVVGQLQIIEFFRCTVQKSLTYDSKKIPQAKTTKMLLPMGVYIFASIIPVLNSQFLNTSQAKKSS